MDILKHITFPQSLIGKTIQPIDGTTLRGMLGVPVKYFTEGKDDLEAAWDFLDDEMWEDALRGATELRWVRF